MITKRGGDQFKIVFETINRDCAKIIVFTFKIELFTVNVYVS